MANQRSSDKPSGYSIDRNLGRYEFCEGKSNKFYEILYAGNDGNGLPEFQTYWGRIGAKNPQNKRISLREAEDKVQEKRRKGYQYIPDSNKFMAVRRLDSLTDIAAEARKSAGLEPFQEVPAAPTRVRM